MYLSIMIFVMADVCVFSYVEPQASLKLFVISTMCVLVMQMSVYPLYACIVLM
jgi:hypothetical protein